MATASPDEARLNFRLRREHKQLIEQAAQAVGQSVSDFAVAALVRDARQTLEEPGVTRLSNRDWEAFLRLLEAESEPNEALGAPRTATGGAGRDGGPPRARVDRAAERRA